MALKEKGSEATAKQQLAAKVEAELQERYGLREPLPPSEFDVFVASLSDDQKPFAKALWQMGCEHKDEVIENTSSILDGVKPTVVRCKHCGLMKTWQGTPASSKRFEWTSFCPDGFDMFEWEDLYQRDKTMWPLIFDEVQYAMLEATMLPTTQEDGQ
jgi:hypothetical protein